jgi:hypothetical protein
MGIVSVARFVQIFGGITVNKVRADPFLGSGMDKIKIWDPGSRINFLDQYF